MDHTLVYDYLEFKLCYLKQIKIVNNKSKNNTWAYSL